MRSLIPTAGFFCMVLVLASCEHETPPLAELGQSCVRQDDCESGRCFDYLGNGVCTRPCASSADCTNGTTCRDLGDWGLLCVPDACQPDCEGKICGDDSCGGSCGTCEGGRTCQNGQCICTPNASSGCHDGDIYWLDSCGNPGTRMVDCPDGCENDRCTGCDPDCAGKECGPDGCGGFCGSCDPGDDCLEGLCETVSDCRQTGCQDFHYCDMATGECKPGCGQDEQCTSGEECDLESHFCVCLGGFERCGQDCVDTSLDPDHCGSCFRECGADEVCVNSDCVSVNDCRQDGCPDGYYCDLSTGDCLVGCAFDYQCGANEVCDTNNHACVCAQGYHRCQGTCVSDQSVDHCGSACTPCPTDAHGTSTCDGTVCGIACDTGYHMCPGGCASDNSTDSCGDSCESCPVDLYGTAVCDGMNCSIQCDTDYHMCPDGCVSGFSPDNCGSSCEPCPADPHGTVTCNGTNCGNQCDSGYHMCPGGCASDFSTGSCGTSCTACPTDPHGTATCDGTSCGIQCDNNYHQCPDGCSWNYSTDHCGASCSPCPTDPQGTAICDGSNCGIDCGTNYHLCPDGCSWDYSVAHCGNRCEPCPGDPNGTPSCDGTDCGMECDQGYLYCDGSCDYCPTSGVGSVECSGPDCVAASCNAGELCGDYCCWWNFGRIYHTQLASSYRYITSIQVDSQGIAHIAAYSDADRTLIYATLSNDAWIVEEVDPEYSTPYGPGESCSLALDDQDRPHIAYVSGEDGVLMYAVRDGDGWDLGPVPAAPSWRVRAVSLALDSQNRPHISCYDNATYDITYYHESAAGWIGETIEPNKYGGYTSIAIDSQDRPHVVYSDGTSDDGWYSFRSSAGIWSTPELLAENAFSGSYRRVAMSLDGQNQPHVLYYHEGNMGLEYARRTSGGWSTPQIVDDSRYNEYGFDLAVDAAGKAHVVYRRYDSSEDQGLYYSIGNQGTWTRRELDTGYTGFAPAITLDASGFPFISYYDYEWLSYWWYGTLDD